MCSLVFFIMCKNALDTLKQLLHSCLRQKEGLCLDSQSYQVTLLEEVGNMSVLVFDLILRDLFSLLPFFALS